MTAQAARESVQAGSQAAAGTGGGAASKVTPLAVRILCLLFAAFVMLENVGQVLWFLPAGSTFPGGTVGVRGVSIVGDGYIRVAAVLPDSPMARAGVVVGNQVRFDRPYDYVRRLQVGERVGFTLDRNGRKTHFEVAAIPRKFRPQDGGLTRAGLFYNLATGLGALFGAFIIWRGGRRLTTLLLGMAVLDYSLIITIPQIWFSAPAVYPFVYLLGSANLAAIPILFYAFALSFYRDSVAPARAWEQAAFWAYAAVAATVGAFFAASGLWAVRFPIIGDPYQAGVYVSYLGFAICFAYLVIGWRRSAPVVQQRYAIMLTATGAIILAQALDVLSSFGDISDAAQVLHFTVNTVLTAVIAYPLFAYAILRHRVLDLGFAVNRTLVYGVVSGVLLGAFGLIEWAVDHFAPIQGREKNALVDAAIALGVFLTFHRVRDVVEHGVEALFFRRWQKAEAQLRRFVRDAAFVRSAEALTRSFANALSSFAEGAPAAVYALGEDGRPRLAAASQPFAPERLDVDDPALVGLRAEPRPIEPEAVGSRLPAALIAPMVNRNEVVGLVLLGLKPSGLAYRPDETELIGWATRQVGLDLHALKVEQLEAEKARKDEEIARLNAKLEGVLAVRTA